MFVKVQKYCTETHIRDYVHGLRVYYEIEFTTIEALHEAVLSVAEVADVGAGIGYEMLGEDFER